MASNSSATPVGQGSGKDPTKDPEIQDWLKVLLHVIYTVHSVGICSLVRFRPCSIQQGLQG